MRTMPSSHTVQRWARRRMRPALLAAASASLAVSLIAGVGPTAASAKATSKPTLVIWYDTARKTMIQAYIKAHPNVNVKAVLKDGDTNGDGTYQSSFALFNRVGHGWPDIYFSEQNNDAASLAQPPYNDAAVLNNGLVPNSVLNNFAHGSSGLCTIDGKVYCLRNDLAMNVLWYNPALMKKDGISSLPTTWQQWAADGKLAAAHGDIIGTQGDSWDADTYYWGNECPLSQRTGQYSITIDPELAELHRDGVAARRRVTHRTSGRVHVQLDLRKHLRREDRVLPRRLVDGRRLPRPGRLQVVEPRLHDGRGVSADVGFRRSRQLRAPSVVACGSCRRTART